MEKVLTAVKRSVFSSVRKSVKHKSILKNEEILLNRKNCMDGLTLLNGIQDNVITVSFFDPQYRGVMDKLSFGNEGERQKRRAQLEQMSIDTITHFIREIGRVLVPSGHLFLWIDKFHLCEGTNHWFNDTDFSIVDLITWDKGKIGMGYRTRRKSEYLLVLQKKPAKAKGVWIQHDIPDVWTEKIKSKVHPHQKPLELQKNLINAVSSPKDYILDPCSGSYSVLKACKLIKRNFVGCDLKNLPK